jgi:hypothetical protein
MSGAHDAVAGFKMHGLGQYSELDSTAQALGPTATQQTNSFRMEASHSQQSTLPPSSRVSTILLSCSWEDGCRQKREKSMNI